MAERNQFGVESLNESEHNNRKLKDHTVVESMAPWVQRSMIGIVIAVVGGGIAAWSNLVIQNNATASRIEAKVEDIGRDFDSFTQIRYQQDLEDTRRRIADVDRVTRGFVYPGAPAE